MTRRAFALSLLVVAVVVFVTLVLPARRDKSAAQEEYALARAERQRLRVTRQAEPSVASPLALEDPLTGQGVENLHQVGGGDSEVFADLPRQEPLVLSPHREVGKGPDGVLGASGQHG